jgi:hypothetical protein
MVLLQAHLHPPKTRSGHISGIDCCVACPNVWSIWVATGCISSISNGDQTFRFDIIGYMDIDVSFPLTTRCLKSTVNVAASHACRRHLVVAADLSV